MNIRDVLEELNIPSAPEGHHHRTSNFEQIECPWCSPDSGRWRLGLSLDGRTASCWTCGSHNLFETLREVTNLSPNTILQHLRALRTCYIEDPNLYKPRGRL